MIGSFPTAGQPAEAELPGLPRGPVDAWLRDALGDEVAAGWTAELISGGLSNITYRLRLADRTVILRRPPLGGVLPSAHDMPREFRVMRALAPTDVPVPRALALCEDPGVLGYPFYVMSDVPGVVLRTAADTAGLSFGQCRALADCLGETLAALHGVDFDAIGLSDYGRADGYAARQVRRWSEQWQRSRTRDLPDMDVLLTRLAAAVPVGSAAIVHGDYRLDNTIVDLDPAGPRITAVVDWELSTLGDPLADLGLALTYWHDPSWSAAGEGAGPLAVSAGATAQAGFPSAAEFAEQYARRTGRDLSSLPFYLALAAMKLGVILEGVHARHLGGHTVSAGYAGVQASVPALAARGLRGLGPAADVG